MIYYVTESQFSTGSESKTFVIKYNISQTPLGRTFVYILERKFKVIFKSVRAIIHYVDGLIRTLIIYLMLKFVNDVKPYTVYVADTTYLMRPQCK